MDQKWVFKMPLENSSGLGSLRLMPGLQIGESDNHIWLRSSQINDRLMILLRTIPDGEFFDVIKGDQIVPFDHYVPSGYLQEMSWLPIQEWYSVDLEKSSLGGLSQSKVQLTMQQNNKPQSVNVIMTSLVRLSDYIDNAPELRIDSLLYAIDSEQRTIITGFPLPPIKGTHYCCSKGITVEAGWIWKPEIDEEVLQRVFSVKKGDMLIFHADNTREIIRAEQFSKVSRSSVRLSMQQFIT